MNELIEHLEYVFTNPVKVKYKKSNVLSFDLSYSMSIAEYVESDGDMNIHYKPGGYNVSIQNYTYILLIKEVECSFDTCIVYINKLRQDEGIINVKECIQYF